MRAKHRAPQGRKARRGVSSTTVLFIALAAGLFLLLYPSVSDYWNSFHQTRAIVSYAESVQNLNQDEYDRLWSEACAYNATLPERSNPFALTDEQAAAYKSQLSFDTSGLMGYIEIPKIKCSLPIYHGTSDGALQSGVGHLEWSSLPVGGLGTHCVLSGHRGLPSARLFTDLDRLELGDTFVLRVLDETLTYEVDQILIVDPSDVDELRIVDGQDYCTLVTCTPYGVNTHRLLVRGHRVANVENNTVTVTANAVQIDPLIIAPLVALPILVVLLVVVLLPRSRRSRPNEDEADDGL